MVISHLFLKPFKFAHEVYVLGSQQIATDRHVSKVNTWDALRSNHNKVIFAAYGLATGFSLLIAYHLKSKPIFQRLGSLIDRATYFAPDIIRVSLGASLIASAFFHSVFGPELPVSSFAMHQFIEPTLYILGIAAVLGVAIRMVGIIISVFWIFAMVDYGWYILTYINYFGEALALALMPKQNVSIDRFFIKYRSRPKYEVWAMPTARILFGASLLYAAINVKFITTALSMGVVNQYHLTNYFHFDPLFVVLGAGLVECLIATLYILGLLQRLNSLVFIGFITVSLLFFKEAVWPHYILLGLAIGIFLHKPDRLSLDSKIGK